MNAVVHELLFSSHDVIRRCIRILLLNYIPITGTRRRLFACLWYLYEFANIVTICIYGRVRNSDRYSSIFFPPFERNLYWCNRYVRGSRINDEFRDVNSIRQLSKQCESEINSTREICQILSTLRQVFHPSCLYNLFNVPSNRWAREFSSSMMEVS